MPFLGTQSLATYTGTAQTSTQHWKCGLVMALQKANGCTTSLTFRIWSWFLPPEYKSFQLTVNECGVDHVVDGDAYPATDVLVIFDEQPGLDSFDTTSRAWQWSVYLHVLTD